MQKWEQLLWRIFSTVCHLLLKRWAPVNDDSDTHYCVHYSSASRKLFLHCWISEASVSHQEMHHGPSLMHTRAHSHTSLLVSSITLTHSWPNGNLHRWRFVMMSPSSPSLKVDTGGLSPQPDTPDTPMSPYLPSPDEVTASGDVVEGVINSGSPPWPVVCPAPSFLMWQIPP